MARVPIAWPPSQRAPRPLHPMPKRVRRKLKSRQGKTYIEHWRPSTRVTRSKKERESE